MMECLHDFSEMQKYLNESIQSIEMLELRRLYQENNNVIEQIETFTEAIDFKSIKTKANKLWDQLVAAIRSFLKTIKNRWNNFINKIRAKDIADTISKLDNYDNIQFKESSSFESLVSLDLGLPSYISESEILDTLADPNFKISPIAKKMIKDIFVNKKMIIHTVTRVAAKVNPAIGSALLIKDLYELYKIMIPIVSDMVKCATNIKTLTKKYEGKTRTINSSNGPVTLAAEDYIILDQCLKMMQRTINTLQKTTNAESNVKVEIGIKNTDEIIATTSSLYGISIKKNKYYGADINLQQLETEQSKLITELKNVLDKVGDNISNIKPSEFSVSSIKGSMAPLMQSMHLIVDLTYNMINDLMVINVDDQMTLTVNTKAQEYLAFRNKYAAVLNQISSIVLDLSARMEETCDQYGLSVKSILIAFDKFGADALKNALKVADESDLENIDGSKFINIRPKNGIDITDDFNKAKQAISQNRSAKQPQSTTQKMHQYITNMQHSST